MDTWRGDTPALCVWSYRNIFPSRNFTVSLLLRILVKLHRLVHTCPHWISWYQQHDQFSSWTYKTPQYHKIQRKRTHHTHRHWHMQGGTHSEFSLLLRSWTWDVEVKHRRGRKAEERRAGTHASEGAEASSNSTRVGGPLNPEPCSSCTPVNGE